MKGQALNRVTNGVAAAGVTLPAWEVHLQHAGVIAASVVPILSALWLAVQIVRFVQAWRAAK
ncbi:hypothetical protein [Stagnihabitans tardus]|uniref:Uncharacterized protein n=1 Tax=Stagnihabitans tardus TaxID=2699202 RepID=A0AAE4YA48_9RHOB|nr:hypothetical protein [Stagnihabitans tardus]NBZ87917.1 hypothetical protein [Stagnihabitans tardus]